MNDKSEIETGIPVPTKDPRTKYPANFVPNGDGQKPYAFVTLSGRFNRTLAPKRFISRKVTENGITGYRIWRLS
jgi:hypothetical protein